LSQTQARPLFSPSRRPPAPPQLAALASSPAKPTLPRKSEPDHPRLTLLGTIVSQSVEIGVFVDEASHDLIRLKAGDVHDGWTLSSIVGRAAFFHKDGYRATTLALPAPRAEAAAPSVAVAPDAERAVTPDNGAHTFTPPVIPAAAEGGSRRPPRED